MDAEEIKKQIEQEKEAFNRKKQELIDKMKRARESERARTHFDVNRRKALRELADVIKREAVSFKALKAPEQDGADFITNIKSYLDAADERIGALEDLAGLGSPESEDGSRGSQ